MQFLTDFLVYLAAFSAGAALTWLVAKATVRGHKAEPAGPASATPADQGVQR